MRRVLAAATVLCVVTSAHGQTILDNSLPQGVSIEELQNAVAHDASDPRSAQYKQIQRVGRVVCGWVNWKNPTGGYDDFKPFVFQLELPAPQLPKESLAAPATECLRSIGV